MGSAFSSLFSAIAGYFVAFYNYVTSWFSFEETTIETDVVNTASNTEVGVVKAVANTANVIIADTVVLTTKANSLGVTVTTKANTAANTK